jgi:hypothetical protein
MNGPPEKSGANYPQYQRKKEPETHRGDMPVLWITRCSQPTVQEAIRTPSKTIDLSSDVTGVYPQPEKGLQQHYETHRHRNDQYHEHPTGQPFDVKMPSLCEFERFKLMWHGMAAVIPVEPKEE